jgi:RNA recognition motif-containing protein
LFKPFGRLLRIDMKRNYAFVQFENIEQATRAKESTNGGMFDKSILTVEYVARQRNDGPPRADRDRRGGGGGGGRDRGPRDRFYDDPRGRGGLPPPMGYDRDRRYDRPPPRLGGGDYDDPRYRRERSPPGGGPGYRRRSRSRSPSPRYGGRRSPPRRYDDYRRRSSPPGGDPLRGVPRRGDSPPPGGVGGGGGPWEAGRRSPDRDFYRGDRGYRP